jgi:hypothetical protein
VYLASIVLLMLVGPAVSVAAEALLAPGAALWTLTAKWFVFWLVGVRLFIAGLRQTLQPQYTAETIFEIADPGARGLVREIGFGNLAIGTLGLCTLAVAGWTVPAALAGGLYYGLAGLGHIARGKRNTIENIALVSDMLAFLLLAAVVATSFASGR